MTARVIPTCLVSLGGSITGHVGMTLAVILGRRHSGNLL